MQFCPGNPVYTVRARAAHQLEDVPCYLLHTFATVLDNGKERLYYVRYARYLKMLCDTPAKAGEVIANLDVLWRDIWFHGGALFSSAEAVWKNWWVGHVSFAVALSLPAELEPLLRHRASTLESADDGSGTCLLQKLTAKLGREEERRLAKQQTNDLLHPRDFISFSENVGRFSWWRSLIHTFLWFLRPAGRMISLPTSSNGPPGGRVRYFLIADPEIKHYKLLTFEQMIDMIRTPRNSFDVCNLSPWQKQIAMI